MVIMLATFTEGSILEIFTWGVATATKRLTQLFSSPEVSRLEVQEADSAKVNPPVEDNILFCFDVINKS